MSLLDRAFVKAYTRSHAQANHVAGQDVVAPSEAMQASAPEPDLASQFSAIQDAVAWSDVSEATYFRVDVGHLSAPRNSARVAPVAAAIPSATILAAAPSVAASAVGVASSVSPIKSPEYSAMRSHALQPTSYEDSVAPMVRRAEPVLHASRSAMSHTLTAYDSAPMIPPVNAPTSSSVNSANRFRSIDEELSADRNEETMQVRIDEAHVARVWTPPAITEPQDYYRPRRNPEEAAEFARAKQEALASENLRAASQQPASFASHINPAIAKAERAIDPAATSHTATVTHPARSSVTPPAARRKPFEPLWEVDAFDFSDTIVQLFGDAKLMKSIGVPLDEAVSNGLRSILITSGKRGAGRTSVAIGIAVSAAAAGLRVALVDADTENAGLADALRLDVTDGWPSAIQNGLPLDEVAIRSIEDQFTVIPTRVDTLANSTKPAEFDYLVNQLRDAFDLVIIDGSAWCDDSSVSQTQLVDAAIMVVDARHRDPAQEAVIQNALRRAGVAGLGIVENFA